MTVIPRPIFRWVSSYLTEEPHGNEAHEGEFVASADGALQVFHRPDDPGAVDQPTLWVRTPE